MKLSDMKAMLAAIEANTYETNPDPDIAFWIRRYHGSERLDEVREKESDFFLDFVIDGSSPITNHRIDAISKPIRQVKGDFTIPLLRANFYL